jgi:hypothetical protein
MNYKIKRGRVEAYKANRGDILAGIQERIIHTLTDADIKKASMLQRVTAAGILYDKERLERGQSTSNQASVESILLEIRDRRSGGKNEPELDKQADSRAPVDK